jgi:hypothetical protein
MSALTFFLVGVVILILSGLYILYIFKTSKFIWKTSPATKCPESLTCCQTDSQFDLIPNPISTDSSGHVPDSTYQLTMFTFFLTVDDNNNLVTTGPNQNVINFKYEKNKISVQKNNTTYYLPVINTDTTSIQFTSDSSKAGNYTICAYSELPAIHTYGIYCIDTNLYLTPTKTLDKFMNVIYLTMVVSFVVSVLWIIALVKLFTKK